MTLSPSKTKIVAEIEDEHSSIHVFEDGEVKIYIGYEAAYYKMADLLILCHRYQQAQHGERVVERSLRNG